VRVAKRLQWIVLYVEKSFLRSGLSNMRPRVWLSGSSRIESSENMCPDIALSVENSFLPNGLNSTLLHVCLNESSASSAVHLLKNSCQCIALYVEKSFLRNGLSNMLLRVWLSGSSRIESSEKFGQTLAQTLTCTTD